MKFKVFFFLCVLAQISPLLCSCTIGTFSEVAGSPFSTGTNPFNVAFSPVASNNLFAAVTNNGSGNLSLYSVNQSTGFFTAVVGSPFTVATNPFGVAFSPLVSGNLFLAATTADAAAGHVYAYLVNQLTGTITSVPNSPRTVGNDPISVAYSPQVSGNLFAAVADGGDTSLSLFSVNTTTGQFTLITTMNVGDSQASIAYSPVVSGNLFSVVALSASIIIYSVNQSTGLFTQVSSANIPEGLNFATFSQDSNGNLFVAATTPDSTRSIYVFLVNQATGALTSVAGSPFSFGNQAAIFAYSPIIGTKEFAAVSSGTGSGFIGSYVINRATGILSSLTTYNFSPSGTPLGIAFSPLLSNGKNLFVASADNTNNNVHVYSVCVGAFSTCSCH